MRTGKLAWLALSLLAAAGCSSAPADWHKPGVSVAETQRTFAACKRTAAAEAADDYDRRTGYMDPNIGRSDLSTRMAAHDTRKREARLVSQCMTDRGFQPRKADGG